MVLRQRLGWYVSAWLLCAWLSMASAKWDHVCTSETRRGTIPQGTCGQSLAELVQTTCMILGQGYSMPKMGKRSLTPQDSHSISQPDKRSIGHYILQGGKPEMADVSPFLKKSKAISYLSHSKRFSNPQGIVCECCYHQCGFSELSEYCSGGDFGKRSVWPARVAHKGSNTPTKVRAFKAFQSDLMKAQLDDTDVTQEAKETQDMTTESSLTNFDFIKNVPKKLLRNLYKMAKADED